MQKIYFVGRKAALFLALLILSIAVGQAEEEWTDAAGQWRYVLEGDNAKITGYLGEPGEDLVFPRALDGYTVTGIDRWMLDETFLTRIAIPDSVASIGANAFADNFTELACVNILDSVTSIGRGAFRYCNFTSVTIPAGVTDIGPNPFEGCPLTFIDVAENNPAYEQNDGVLFDRRQKMLVAYPHLREGNPYTIPEGVLSIGEGAFANNGRLMSVTIPSSLVSIGDTAFWGCTSLRSVTIPASVTSVGYMAFDMCDNLTSVTIPGSVTSIGDWAFGAREGTTLYVKADSYAEQYAKDNDIPYVLDLE